LELQNFTELVQLTHRRRLTPTFKEKQRPTSSVQALLGTALFFFAQPYGWVAVGRENSARDL